ERTTNELEDITKEIYELAGEEFNISSPKQLGEVLFDKMKITSKPKKTKTGQYSTSEEVLNELSSKSDLVKLVLKFVYNRFLPLPYSAWHSPHTAQNDPRESIHWTVLGKSVHKPGGHYSPQRWPHRQVL
ncbi:MAG: hypothetical protein EBX03_15225, partial [Rhodobacteraceae bacterium]|nr:hypothetical protein [Paracoccaceae bacterium]